MAGQGNELVLVTYLESRGEIEATCQEEWGKERERKRAEKPIEKVLSGHVCDPVVVFARLGPQSFYAIPRSRLLRPMELNGEGNRKVMTAG